MLSRLLNHLSYSVLSFDCFEFLQKHLVVCSSRPILGTIAVSESVRLTSDIKGTQREILRERPKNIDKVWIKLSEAIFSILGDCWEKCICSSLPAARLTEGFPASKVHLQPATWLTGGGEGVGNWVGLEVEVHRGGRFLTNKTYQLFLTLNCLFPSNTLLPKTCHFFHISQPANTLLKNRYLEEKVRWLPLWHDIKPHNNYSFNSG